MLARHRFTDWAQSIRRSTDAPACSGNDYLDMEGVTPIVELAVGWLMVWAGAAKGALKIRTPERCLD
jgi:hypothetical protein